MGRNKAVRKEHWDGITKSKSKSAENEVFDGANDPYQDLGNAIVARAYKDYVLLEFASYDYVTTREGKVVHTVYEKNGQLGPTVNKKEIEDFFDSPLYSAITDISGDAILGLAKKEIVMIKKAFEEGLMYEQFSMTNNDKMFCISKYDYKYMRESLRKKNLILFLIDKFEQAVAIKPRCADWIHPEKQMYHICHINPAKKGNVNWIYIAKNDNFNFYRYIYDKKTKKGGFYKIFNKSTICKNLVEFKKGERYLW